MIDRVENFERGFEAFAGQVAVVDGHVDGAHVVQRPRFAPPVAYFARDRVVFDGVFERAFVVADVLITIRRDVRGGSITVQIFELRKQFPRGLRENQRPAQTRFD